MAEKVWSPFAFLLKLLTHQHKQFSSRNLICGTKNAHKIVTMCSSVLMSTLTNPSTQTQSLMTYFGQLHIYTLCFSHLSLNHSNWHHKQQNYSNKSFAFKLLWYCVPVCATQLVYKQILKTQSKIDAKSKFHLFFNLVIQLFCSVFFL